MNTCVCCGAIIPEGRQICRYCSDAYFEKDKNKSEEVYPNSIGTSDSVWFNGYGTGGPLNVSKHPTMVQPKTNTKKNTKNFEIKKVIFNNPATIVYWTDGTKTVVKAQKGDMFDPEKGLTMAFTKKALGNEGSYYNTIKKWTDKYELDMFQRFLDTL